MMPVVSLCDDCAGDLYGRRRLPRYRNMRGQYMVDLCEKCSQPTRGVRVPRTDQELR